MTVKLVGSTSGSVSLQAPASTSGGAHRVLTLPDANATLATTSDSFGKVLQVVQTTKTDTASNSTASGGSWTPTTPKCSITPSNASNKILIQATIPLAIAQDQHNIYLTVLKDGSPMSFIGDANGNMTRSTVGTFNYNNYRFQSVHYNYLDTAGGTSAIEYSLKLTHDSGSTTTIYLNRTEATDNSDDRHRGAANIILTEIAA